MNFQFSLSLPRSRRHRWDISRTTVWGKAKILFFFKCSCTAEINLNLPASHFVHCEAVVFFLQSLLCVLEGLEDELLLPLGLHAGHLWEVAGGTGQPPQELCIITRWKETADVTQPVLVGNRRGQPYWLSVRKAYTWDLRYFFSSLWQRNMSHFNLMNKLIHF